ncbi:hypothetical protein [Halobacillus sp. K22]|uniref:hypothetical protein n=1 Tax=Halobacillus sp. K22 TaxID=3457431 RepID=UPI003FCDACD2
MNLKKMMKYLKPIVLFSLVLAIGCSNSGSGGDSSSSSAEENNSTVSTTEVGNNSSSSNEENSEGSESKQNIRTVLQNIFNGPNEKQEKIFSSSELGKEKSLEKLVEFREENIKPYVSENLYEGMINTNGATIPLRMAHPDYKLKTEDIMIEAQENYYKFTVKVTYTNNKNDDSTTMEVRGHAQTNEEGKVSSINYNNLEELLSSLS